MIANKGWTIMVVKSEGFDRKYIITAGEEGQVGKIAYMNGSPIELIDNDNNIFYAIKNENIICYE